VNASKWADMVALLVKAPRTVDELAGLTKLDRTTIYRWRDALIGEGLVCVKGRTPSGARIYVWDPIINRSDDDTQRSAS
jgi:predicted transcriptional regulator